MFIKDYSKLKEIVGANKYGFKYCQREFAYIDREGFTAQDILIETAIRMNIEITRNQLEELFGINRQSLNRSLRKIAEDRGGRKLEEYRYAGFDFDKNTKGKKIEISSFILETKLSCITKIMLSMFYETKEHKIEYTNEEICKRMNIGVSSITKSLNELKKNDLIYVEHVGTVGKRKRTIYL